MRQTGRKGDEVRVYRKIRRVTLWLWTAQSSAAEQNPAAMPEQRTLPTSCIAEYQPGQIGSLAGKQLNLRPGHQAVRCAPAMRQTVLLI